MYNLAMREQKEDEAMTYLVRLKESCREYIRTKSPVFASGKRRKAMISCIADKVDTLLRQNQDHILEEKDSGYESFQQRKTEKNINEACKANHNLMYQYLQGNIELKNKDLKELDSHMEEILKEVGKQKVDNNQKDATNLAKQLAGTSKGKNRHYLSNGIYGKGTYFAVRSDNKNAKDNKTSEHCWRYGRNVGSVQVNMCLNSNARIIDLATLEKLVEDFEKKFPKVYAHIVDHERRGSISGGKEYLTIFASFFGYNSIKGNVGTGDNLTDYYVVSDRKAMTLYNTGFMRTDTDDIKPTWFDLES